jgi:nucleoside-diphosphate-sugar epimerase
MGATSAFAAESCVDYIIKLQDCALAALRYCCFTVYGPRQHFPDMKRRCRHRGEDQAIPVYGDGRQTRDLRLSVML